MDPPATRKENTHGGSLLSSQVKNLFESWEQVTMLCVKQFANNSKIKQTAISAPGNSIFSKRNVANRRPECGITRKNLHGQAWVFPRSARYQLTPY